MEENKYYTPSIDEFYVGFEFEHRDPYYGGREEFQKAIIKSDDLVIYPDEDGMFNYFEAEHLLSNILYDITKNNIRVKRLDKQDLVELGLNEDPSGERYFEFNGHQLYFDIHQDFNVTIYNDDSIIVFQGNVKNKSELIKVLKMLGIK